MTDPTRKAPDEGPLVSPSRDAARRDEEAWSIRCWKADVTAIRQNLQVPIRATMANPDLPFLT